MGEVLEVVGPVELAGEAELEVVLVGQPDELDDSVCTLGAFPGTLH